MKSLWAAMALFCLLIFTCLVSGQDAPSKDGEVGEMIKQLQEKYVPIFNKLSISGKESDLDDKLSELNKEWLLVLYEDIIREHMKCVIIIGTADYLENQGHPRYNAFLKKYRGYLRLLWTIIKNDYKSIKPILLSTLKETNDGSIKGHILYALYQVNMNKEKYGIDENDENEDVKLFVSYLDDKQNQHEMTRLSEFPPQRVCDLVFRFIVKIYDLKYEDIGITGEERRWTSPERIPDEDISKLKKYLENVKEKQSESNNK